MSSTEIGRHERSSSSRFIDYSCSTDWEKRVLKIENFIRALVLKGKHNDYEIFSVSDMKLKISLHCNAPTNTSSYFSHLFDIEGRYILVSRPGNNWLDCTTSMKHSLFSALITAIQSCTLTVNSDNRVPPIFLTMSNETDIKEFKIIDVMGYQIFNRPNSSIVVNYSTISSEMDQSTNDFRYVDSLVQLFESQLMNRYSTEKTRNMHQSGNFFAQVTEISSIKASLLLASKENTTLHFDSSLSTHQSCLVNNFWMSLLISSNGVENGADNSTSVGGGVIKEGIKCNTLSVTLVYPAMKISSIVDNVDFTTLIPSKQLSNCWSINANFTPLQIKDVDVSLSACIRRLLASFILCKSCVSAVTMSSFSSNSSVSGQNDVSLLFSPEKAQSIAVILSEQSRKAVLDMCTSNSSGVYLDEQHANFLLTNLFYGDENKSSKSEYNLPISSQSSIDDVKNLVEKCAGTNIEILSMYAISSGGLQGGMIMSASLYSKFISVLRSRWEMEEEEGVYI